MALSDSSQIIISRVPFREKSKIFLHGHEKKKRTHLTYARIPSRPKQRL
jgi:hypothetical protein